MQETHLILAASQRKVGRDGVAIEVGASAKRLAHGARHLAELSGHGRLDLRGLVRSGSPNGLCGDLMDLCLRGLGQGFKFGTEASLGLLVVATATVIVKGAFGDRSNPHPDRASPSARLVLRDALR